MTTLFEQQGGTYSEVGDYIIPNLCVPDGNYLLGKYGRMRLDFLKRHRRVLYVNLYIACNPGSFYKIAHRNLLGKQIYH